MSDSVRLLESVKQAAVLRLQNITPNVLDLEIRWVIDEFLLATRVWRRNLPIITVIGQIDYHVGIADDETVAVLIEGVRDNNSYSTMRLGIAHRNYVETGSVTTVGMLDDRTVRVYPVPNLIETFWLDVALGLSPALDTLPPAELRPYFPAILDGLLARMYAIPDKPWTNFKLVDGHLQRFESAKSVVRREAEMGRVKGPLFTRFPVI